LKARMKGILRTLATSGPMPWIFRPLMKGHATIFMMHRFRDTDPMTEGHDPDLLDRALREIKRAGFRAVSIMDVIRAGQNGDDLSDMVAFTVDDGHADFHRVAVPVFAQHRCPVTVFLTTDFLDHRRWLWPDRLRFIMDRTSKDSVSLELEGKPVTLTWDDDQVRARTRETLTWTLVDMVPDRRARALGELEAQLAVSVPDEVLPPFEPMTWDQVREDAELGVTFAPHSASHPNMGFLNPAELAREIDQSWERVKAQTEAAIPVFCFPFGRVGDCPKSAEEPLTRAHLSAAVTAVPGYVTSSEVRHAPFFLPRFPWPDEMADLRQVLFGVGKAKALLRSRAR